MERLIISLEASLARLTSREHARHQFDLIPVSLEWKSTITACISLCTAIPISEST